MSTEYHFKAFYSQLTCKLAERAHRIVCRPVTVARPGGKFEITRLTLDREAPSLFRKEVWELLCIQTRLGWLSIRTLLFVRNRHIKICPRGVTRFENTSLDRTNASQNEEYLSGIVQ